MTQSQSNIKWFAAKKNVWVQVLEEQIDDELINKEEDMQQPDIEQKGETDREREIHIRTTLKV